MILALRIHFVCSSLASYVNCSPCVHSASATATTRKQTISRDLKTDLKFVMGSISACQADRIDGSIWIGSEMAARDVGWLESNGIHHVLNVSSFDDTSDRPALEGALTRLELQFRRLPNYSCQLKFRMCGEAKYGT